MRVKSPQKLVGLAILWLGLAIALTLQSASGVVARRAPDISVSLMSANGEAVDRLAFQEFAADVGDQGDGTLVVQSAVKARPLAMQALTIEPLLSRSLTIVGLGLSDQLEQAEFVELANAINRRDVALQGVRLANQAASEDFEGVFQTVDRILRVDPDVGAQFHPILVTALRDERGAELLIELAEAKAPWINAFLNYAVLQDDVLPQLIEFRRRVDPDNERFDDRLIRSLVRDGAYGSAQDLYRVLIAKSGSDEVVENDPLGWQTEFPPLGWSLADRSGVRAQLTRDGEGLEVYVGSGQDGILAERVIAAPAGPFGISITHDLTRVAQLEYVRLLLHCGDIALPFLNEPLSAQRARYSGLRAPNSCSYVHVVLYARVFSTQPTLRGTIARIELLQGTRSVAP